MEVALCLLALAVPLLLWEIISPQSAWETLESWRYKHPEQNEPSEAGYTVRRVAAGFGLVMVVIVAVIAVSVLAEEDDQSDQNDREDSNFMDECDDDNPLRDDCSSDLWDHDDFLNDDNDSNLFD